MTITLEISHSQERELREIASQQGQEPEAFLLSLLDEAILQFRHEAQQRRKSQDDH